MASSPVITGHDVARYWVLITMSDGAIRTRSQIYSDAVLVAKIGKEELSVKNTSGQVRVENQLGWAMSDLVKAGLLDRIARATYRITTLGSDLSKQWWETGFITDKMLISTSTQWQLYLQSVKERRKQQISQSQEREMDIDQVIDTDYEQQAITAVQELENLLAVDLLERLRTQTPEFFEKAVIRTLLAMGYGGKENLFEHVGKSHDGGIDGVIKQDPLGIQNIYIQAKRYHDGNTIGSKEIQSFVGALQGRGVERGVFITTSSFTKSAKEYAEKLLGKVVLIDGQDLVTLMIRYKVGIQTKQLLEICEIDEDFFE